MPPMRSVAGQANLHFVKQRHVARVPGPFLAAGRPCRVFALFRATMSGDAIEQAEGSGLATIRLCGRTTILVFATRASATTTGPGGNNVVQSRLQLAERGFEWFLGFFGDGHVSVDCRERGSKRRTRNTGAGSARGASAMRTRRGERPLSGRRRRSLFADGASEYLEQSIAVVGARLLEEVWSSHACRNGGQVVPR